MHYEHCNLHEHLGTHSAGKVEVKDENHNYVVGSVVTSVVVVDLRDYAVSKDYERVVIDQHFDFRASVNVD